MSAFVEGRRRAPRLVTELEACIRAGADIVMKTDTNKSLSNAAGTAQPHLDL